MPASVFLLGSVAVGVVGQVVLKLAMSRVGPLLLGRRNALSILRCMVTSPLIWLGFLTYGLSAFLWIVGLSSTELGYAYPFISLSYALILLASWRLFRERITIGRLMGVALICFGVYIIAGS